MGRCAKIQTGIFFGDADDSNESITAYLMNNGQISIDIDDEGISEVYLSQEQAAEFARQLLDLCEPEYKI